MSKRSKRAFLVGAGISANPPTNLPTAGNWINSIIRAISPDDRTRNMLQKFTDSSKYPSGYIRFELLLEVLQNIVDPNLSILKVLEQFSQPNDLHYFLAKRAASGDLVITTNFDSLIEQALIDLGYHSLTVARRTDFTRWEKILSSPAVPVFKLHGTYFEYDGRHRSIASETVQATLEAVASSNQPLILPKEKRDFLQNALKSRTLVVIGYSGTDDFDIMPTLIKSPPQSLTWIEHCSHGRAENITYKVKALLRRENLPLNVGKYGLFKIMFAGGNKCFDIYHGQTAQMLYHLYPESKPLNKIQTENSISNFSAFIDQWAFKVTSERAIKHAFAAELLTRVGRFRPALFYYDAAWEKTYPKNPIRLNSARRLSHLSIRIGENENALRWAREAIKLTIYTRDPKVRAACFHQIGFAYYKTGNKRWAHHWHMKCLDSAERADLKYWGAVSLHHLAMLAQDSGDYNTAMRLYRQSIALASQIGAITFVSWSFHQLATCKYDHGDFRNARRYLNKALSIAALVGDVNEQAVLEHEFGLLDFIAGDVKSAIDYYNAALQHYKEAGAGEFRGVELQHLGEAYLELDNIQSAGRYFCQALRELKRVKDKETLSEFYSYLALYQLEQGNLIEARGTATLACRLSRRYGLPTYQKRADFVVGIVQSLEKKDNGQIIEKALRDTMKTRLVPLLMDLLYWTARLQIKLTGNDQIFYRQFRWALKKYQYLGNLRRSNIIEHYLKKIRF